MALPSKNEQRLEESNKLVVYISHKEEIYGPIVREFEKRTGIWVEVVTGGTNDLLDRIEEENGKDSGDVVSYLSCTRLSDKIIICCHIV